MLWTEPIDGRIGLAGVHGGGAVCAGHERGERLSRKVFSERKGGGSGGKRRGVLEIKTAGEAGARLTARRGLQCRGIAVGGRKRLRWGELLGDGMQNKGRKIDPKDNVLLVQTVLW